MRRLLGLNLKESCSFHRRVVVDGNGRILTAITVINPINARSLQKTRGKIILPREKTPHESLVGEKIPIADAIIIPRITLRGDWDRIGPGIVTRSETQNGSGVSAGSIHRQALRKPIDGDRSSAEDIGVMEIPRPVEGAITIRIGCVLNIVAVQCGIGRRTHAYVNRAEGIEANILAESICIRRVDACTTSDEL